MTDWWRETARTRSAEEKPKVRSWSLRTFNTKANRDAMLRASERLYREDLTLASASGKDMPRLQAKAYDEAVERADTILLLALPELEILDWDQSMALFGCMWPDKGIYTEPHKHRHSTCGCVTECPWPHKVSGKEMRTAPCQAIEHWDKRCDDHFSAWWADYGKAAAEAWEKANPPKWIHDHEGPIGGWENVACGVVGCRNFGKEYNGHEIWNGEI